MKVGRVAGGMTQFVSEALLLYHALVYYCCCKKKPPRSF